MDSADDTQRRAADEARVDELIRQDHLRARRRMQDPRWPWISNPLPADVDTKPGISVEQARLIAKGGTRAALQAVLGDLADLGRSLCVTLHRTTACPEYMLAAERMEGIIERGIDTNETLLLLTDTLAEALMTYEPEHGQAIIILQWGWPPVRRIVLHHASSWRKALVAGERQIALTMRRAGMFLLDEPDDPAAADLVGL